MNKAYIYIFEDGDINISNEPPTEGDFGCINDGTLQVLLIRDSLVWDVPEPSRMTALNTAKKVDGYHVPG